MRKLRPVTDVSDLPDVAFGLRDIAFWGTIHFVVIEGFTLALCAVVFVYLGRNFEEIPPPGTALPSLLVPTIHVLLMLASVPLMVWINKAAMRFDLARVKLGLTIAAVVCTAFVALRLVELLVSVNVRWDTNAYGSAQWLVLGAHGTLLAIELLEIAGMAAIFWIAPVEKRHFSDASDLAFYWYFMVGSWLPLYALCFLGPHLV